MSYTITPASDFATDSSINWNSPPSTWATSGGPTYTYRARPMPDTFQEVWDYSGPGYVLIDRTEDKEEEKPVVSFLKQITLV